MSLALAGAGAAPASRSPAASSAFSAARRPWCAEAPPIEDRRRSLLRCGTAIRGLQCSRRPRAAPGSPATLVARAGIVASATISVHPEYAGGCRTSRLSRHTRAGSVAIRLRAFPCARSVDYHATRPAATAIGGSIDCAARDARTGEGGLVPEGPLMTQTAHDGRMVAASSERDPAAGVTRVLLVDDHRAFSEALAMAIDSFPDLTCVGTPTTITDALAVIPQAGPDVVLMDIYLPDGNGIEAIAGIRALQPGVRILVMTGHTDVDVMAR